jgi:hypothetical protein
MKFRVPKQPQLVNRLASAGRRCSGIDGKELRSNKGNQLKKGYKC